MDKVARYRYRDNVQDWLITGREVPLPGQSFIVSLERPNHLDSVQLSPTTLIAKQLLSLGGPGCVLDIRQAGADDRRNRMPPLIESIRNQCLWEIEREKNPDPVDWSTRRDTSSP